LDIDLGSEFPGLKVENENVAVREEEEVAEYKLDPFGKVADPVRIYLKEMGSFSLLTREGEVEIAKRIESEQREVLSAVFNCPIAIQEVINLGNDLHTGKTTIKEVTNEIDNEETSIEEEQIQKKRVLNLIKKIQRGGERIRILRGELKLRNKEVQKKRIHEKILKKRTKIFDAFKRINLGEKQINRIVEKLKQWDIRMEKAQREVRKYEEDWDFSSARKSLKVIKKKVSKENFFRLRRIKLKDWKEMIRIGMSKGR
jgi:RNA polymerase primary sigma factor